MCHTPHLAMPQGFMTNTLLVEFLICSLAVKLCWHIRQHILGSRRQSFDLHLIAVLAACVPGTDFYTVTKDMEFSNCQASTAKFD